MKKLILCCALIIALIVVSGCAGISTYPARSNEPRGIRVYPQKIYLLVGDNKSKFVSLKIEEAQLKELTSNQDTTAALSLVQKIVELAAKAAEPGIKAMPVIEFESSIGFKAGIYELSETGLFKKVSP
ncbi:MAG: hypothetical protein ABSG71_19125 [Thermodesulfobacteriota bacterium]